MIPVFLPTDINECAAEGQNNCDAAASCFNTQGGYECACQIGYTGDGFICTGMISIWGIDVHVMMYWLEMDYTGTYGRQFLTSAPIVAAW